MTGDTIEIDQSDIPDAVIMPDAPANPKSVPAAMAILDALRSGGGDLQSVMMNALAGQTGMPPEVGMLMKMFAGDSGGNSAEHLELCGKRDGHRESPPGGAGRMRQFRRWPGRGGDTS